MHTWAVRDSTPESNPASMTARHAPLAQSKSNSTTRCKSHVQLMHGVQTASKAGDIHMHPRSRWNTSNRRHRLPPPTQWAAIRRQVQARAHNKCQAQHHAKGCTGTGTECDHIKPGDNHNLDNLQWLSHECHKAKTDQETRERNHQQKTIKQHPKERHPGQLD